MSRSWAQPNRHGMESWMSENDDLIRRAAVAFWGSEVRTNAMAFAKQAIDVVEPLLREQIAKEDKEAAEPAPPPAKPSGARQFKTGPAAPKPDPEAHKRYVTAEEVEGMIVTALLGQQAEFTAVARETALQRSETLAELRALVASLLETQWNIIGTRTGGDNPVTDNARGAAEALSKVLEWIDKDISANERNSR